MLPKSSHLGRLTRFSNFNVALLATVSLTLALYLPFLPACAQQAQNNKGSTSKAFLYDRFYFTSDSDGLITNGGGTIHGIGGSILERQLGDKFNLVYGVFTVTTGSKPLSVSVGPLLLDIPPSSSLSFRLTNDSAITTHTLSAPVTIVGVADNDSPAAGTVRTSIGDKMTLPGGSIPVQPLSKGSTRSLTAPLFFIGNAQFNSENLTKQKEASPARDSISISSGQIFLSPTRDLNVITPFGAIRAKANSRFFLSLNDGASTARILNCCSSEITVQSGKKFRRILPSQEFCLFDHRPTQEEVLPADGLGRKEVTMHDVDGQRTAATNTFLIVSMLASPYFLGEWKRDSALDKKITSGLLKSAAAFDTVQPRAEEFYITPNNFYPNTLDKGMR